MCIRDSSWGMLGNQQIGNDYYPYINTYATNAKYPFDNKVSGGAVQTENKIQDISWEKTTTSVSYTHLIVEWFKEQIR